MARLTPGIISSVFLCECAIGHVPIRLGAFWVPRPPPNDSPPMVPTVCPRVLHPFAHVWPTTIHSAPWGVPKTTSTNKKKRTYETQQPNMSPWDEKKMPVQWHCFKVPRWAMFWSCLKKCNAQTMPDVARSFKLHEASNCNEPSHGEPCTLLGKSAFARARHTINSAVVHM